ncbi:unnamed protein product [Cochlearia groenlandica]
MAEEERLSMKRKEIDRVNDEFSDFSLSSPSKKIRRLDLDLPPIMEEEEVDMVTVTEELEDVTVNEERSIVLYKPLLHYHSPSPSSGNLFVDTDLISGFKNRFLRDASIANDTKHEDEKTNKCQAVVCWNPSQSPYSQSVGAFKQPRTLEITELDESGEDAVMDDVAAMETEEEDTGLSFVRQEEPSNGFGLHQWQRQQQQQQNFMIPQLPQVSTTPITWFR